MGGVGIEWRGTQALLYELVMHNNPRASPSHRCAGSLTLAKELRLACAPDAES